MAPCASPAAKKGQTRLRRPEPRGLRARGPRRRRPSARTSRRPRRPPRPPAGPRSAQDGRRGTRRQPAAGEGPPPRAPAAGSSSRAATRWWRPSGRTCRHAPLYVASRIESDERVKRGAEAARPTAGWRCSRAARTDLGPDDGRRASTRASRSQVRRTSTPTRATCSTGRAGRPGPAGRRARRRHRPAQPRGRRALASRRSARHGVLVPERRAAGMTASAWKVSAGAAARVPVARATNLDPGAGGVPGGRAASWSGWTPTATSTLADLEVATEPLVLVVGSEGRGLSRLVRETCDAIVSIPMAGRRSPSTPGSRRVSRCTTCGGGARAAEGGRSEGLSRRACRRPRACGRACRPSRPWSCASGSACPSSPRPSCGPSPRACRPGCRSTSR